MFLALLSVAALLARGQGLQGSALTAASSYEFTAFRMQQWDAAQRQLGCRGAVVVAEARSCDEPVLTRRCVVLTVSDFSSETFLEAQRQNAAALLVLLPRNTSGIPAGTAQAFMRSERDALQGATPIPVYVALEDEQLLYMYEEVRQAAAIRTSSIFIRVLRSMITATAFQILVSNNAPIQAAPDTTFVTLEGVLPGAGEDVPTIVITAHYDAHGLAPWLSHGADSNASGVVVLLELARLFHRLYSSASTRPPFHLLFSLTGGGKHNFLGTKRWIEENLDHAESSLLHDNVALVLCLDTLANGDELHAHVSRPPRPDSPLHAFLRQLEEVVSSRFPWVRTGMVHKKINLGESTVAWEHERYSLRRLPAFTLSRLEDPRSEQRTSILDDMTRVDFRKLKRNGLIVAETLARFMFGLSDLGTPKEMQLFRGQMDFHDGRMSSLMWALTSVPRAQQLLDREAGQVALLSTLEQEFRHYLQQVQRHTFRQDRRDPDLTFFDQMKQPMVMYRVKPAAFDLFLGGCIAAYLGVVYSAIQNFGFLYTRVKAAVKTKACK